MMTNARATAASDHPEGRRQRDLDDAKLRSVLGVAEVTFKAGQQRLAIIDTRCRADAGTKIMTKDFVRIAALGGLLGLLAGVAVMAAPIGAETAVKIDNFTFAPQRVTVKAGTTVTWTNEDDIPHTVASTTMAFRSKALDTDDKFSFTFTTAGVYDYFCSLHPHMTGTIVVETASGSNPAP
jgi:plastocyanin